MALANFARRNAPELGDALIAIDAIALTVFFSMLYSGGNCGCVGTPAQNAPKYPPASFQ